MPDITPRDRTIVPSGMMDERPPRRVVGAKIQRETVPYRKSSYFNRHSRVIDMALFHGRSFRVGWGPGDTIVHCSNETLDQKDKGSIILDARDSNISVII